MKKTTAKHKKIARPGAKKKTPALPARKSKPARPAASPRAAGTAPARVQAILRGLDEAYPEVTCALIHESPFQLLISTILADRLSSTVRRHRFIDIKSEEIQVKN